MRKLKWGLAGCGDIARKRVAPALRDLPEADFVGVVRLHAEGVEAFAREFGARKWYATYMDMLDDPEIEAVYLATPTHIHFMGAALAAQAKKHVLSEKPMARKVPECKFMIDMCRKNNVRLGIAYYRHFYPVVRRMKEILASDEIGRPVLAKMDAFEYFNPAPDDPRHWFVEKETAGGGPMFDFGCHRIEVLIHLLGQVRWVQGQLANVVFRREVEDTGTVEMIFETGAQGVITVTYAAFEARDTFDLYCTDGSIHIPRLNAGEMIVRTREGERSEFHPPHPNLHYPLIEDFTRAVLEGRKPAVDGKKGLAVNRVLSHLY